MPDKDAFAKLGFELDQNSASQIKQYVAGIEQDFGKLDRAMAKVGGTADQAGKELIKGIRQARQELEAAKKSADGLGDSVTKAGKVSGVEGLRRTGSAVSQLISPEIGGTISRAGDAVQIVKELGAVTTVAGPAAIALGAVVAAGIIYNNNIKDQEAQLGSLARVQKQYFDVLESGTTQEAASKLRASQNELKSLEAQRANLKSRINEEFGAEQTSTLGDLGARIRTATKQLFNEDFKQAGQATDELDKKILDAKTSVDLFTKGLQENAFAANDAYQAEQKLADARRDQNIKLVEMVEFGTADQAQRLIKQDQIRRDELEKEARTLGQSKDPGDQAKAQDLQKQADALGDEIKKLQGLLANGFQTDKAKQALKLLDDQRTYELQLNDLKRTGLQKDLDAELRKRDEEIRANQAEISSLEVLKDSTGEYTKRIDELKARNAQLITQQEQLIGQAQFSIDLNEKEARDKRLVEVRAKFEKETEAAEQKSADAKLAIQRKYVDATIAATERLAEAGKAALQKLEQQRDDLRTGLNRDLSKEDRDALDKELDIQIKSHRQEQQDLTNHLRQLKQIRDDANARDKIFLLERNFLGLLESRIQRGADEGREGTSYENRKTDLQTGQRNELEDLKRSIDIQRRERRISYDQAREDAALAYRREIAQANEAKRVELQQAEAARRHDLQDLSNKLIAEQNIRRRAYGQELQMASLYGDALVKVEQRIGAARLAAAQRDLVSLSGSRIVDSQGVYRRPFGGDTQPGQAYLVNDARQGQRERVGGMQFMGDMGVYMPFKPGYVDPGSGGGSRPVSVSISQQITSAAPDAAGLARDLKPYMRLAAVELVEKMNR